MAKSSNGDVNRMCSWLTFTRQKQGSSCPTSKMMVFANGPENALKPQALKALMTRTRLHQGFSSKDQFHTALHWDPMTCSAGYQDQKSAIISHSKRHSQLFRGCWSMNCQRISVIGLFNLSVSHQDNLLRLIPLYEIVH